MSWIRSNGPFVILILLNFWLLVFTIWDIIFDKGWKIVIISSYALLITLIFILIYFRSTKLKVIEDSIQEFEKTLEGGLYHFRCPSCKGFFAVKKSKGNNNKPLKMTCPDCGLVASIPVKPLLEEDEIPEKKSIGVTFKCESCNEGITIWAEGSELYQNMHVYCCPFCGKEGTMNKN